MDENQLHEIFKELEAAGLSGEIDSADDESVMKFIQHRLGEKISPEECAYDEKLLNLYLEQEELKLKIKKEKEKGSYATFHTMLLRGELKITDHFVTDILCKKNTTQHRRKIEKCKECLLHEQCPKRALIRQNIKNGFHGNINKTLKERAKIISTYDEIKEGGATYEAAKEDTMKKIKISKRTFEKYHRTRDMRILQALKSLLKK